MWRWIGKWRRKPSNGDQDKYVQVFNIICDILMPECSLLGGVAGLTFEDGSGINGPALGYVYGICDAALASANLDIDNDLGKMTVDGIYKLLSTKDTSNYLAYLINNNAQISIYRAIIDGGETYIAWIKSGGKKTPWGLGKYIKRN